MSREGQPESNPVETDFLPDITRAEQLEDLKEVGEKIRAKASLIDQELLSREEDIEENKAKAQQEGLVDMTMSGRFVNKQLFTKEKGLREEMVAFMERFEVLEKKSDPELTRAFVEFMDIVDRNYPNGIQGSQELISCGDLKTIAQEIIYEGADINTMTSAGNLRKAVDRILNDYKERGGRTEKE